MPIEDGAGGRARSASTATASGVSATVAAANTLAPSAKAEAERLLECLLEVLPTLEEALSMTDKVCAVHRVPSVSPLRKL